MNWAELLYYSQKSAPSGKVTTNFFGLFFLSLKSMFYFQFIQAETITKLIRIILCFAFKNVYACVYVFYFDLCLHVIFQ